MSEVRKGYKMTELGEIPIDWEVKKIRDIAITSSGGTPNRSKKEFYENGTIPWLKTGELKKKYIKDIDEFITEEAVKSSSAKLVRRNSVIVAMYGATIGQLAILPFEATTNQACCAISLDEENDYEFLYYYLKNNKDKIIKLSAGGAQPNISQEIIKNLVVPKPSKIEQQKISSILSTVDKQIDETGQLIEKIRELKKGLMQQLLIKGIGHTKFKQTELGEIPVEWDVRKIRDIATTSSGGTPNRSKKEFYEGGTVPWIKTGELKKKYIATANEYITEEAILASSAKLVEENSIIVAMYGATIGHVSILPYIATTNQACCSISVEENYDYEFLYYFLKANSEKLVKLSAGGAQPNISQEIIKNFLVVKPSKEEQQKIAEILSTVDEQIEAYEEEKVKYEELKKGLMQKLLTGQIRVKI